MAPLSWSLDHCGPMARVVEDLAHMLNAIAGHDPKDPTSSSMPVVDYASALRADVKGMVIGVPRDYIDECAPRTAPIVLKRVEEAIGGIEILGRAGGRNQSPDAALGDHCQRGDLLQRILGGA